MCGGETGAGRLTRYAIVVVLTASSFGWSCRVLTVQRSVPQTMRDGLLRAAVAVCATDASMAPTAVAITAAAHRTLGEMLT